MDLLVKIDNQRVRIPTNLNYAVEGSQKFVKFHFKFTENWDNLTIFAQFGQNKKAYNVYLDNQNCVYLPKEIVEGECTLMLYGTGGDVIATTNYLRLRIDKNILVENADSTEISTSLYNQLVNKVNAVDNRVSNMINDPLFIEKVLGNIKVGGRNLALEQSLEYKVYSEPFKNENTTIYIGKVLTDGLNIEDSVTICFNLKVENLVNYEGSVPRLYVQGEGDVTHWGNGGFPAKLKEPLENGVYIIKYNAKITKEHLKNNNWSITFRIDGVKSGKISWKKFKVERGTINTDWSPAIEDIQSDINDASTVANQAKTLAESSNNELKTLKPIAKSASFTDLVNVPNIIIGDKKYTLKVSNSIPTVDDKSIITIVI